MYVRQSAVKKRPFEQFLRWLFDKEIIYFLSLCLYLFCCNIQIWRKFALFQSQQPLSSTMPPFIARSKFSNYLKTSHNDKNKILQS